MIREYLLGELPANDSSDVEERLLLDDGFYQELLVVEDELIDSYLSGQLSDTETRHFESHFLTTPERYEKLRFARYLKKYVGEAALAESDQVSSSGVPAQSERSVVPSHADKRSFLSFFPFRNPVLGFSLGTALMVLLAVAVVLVVNNVRTPRGPGKILAVELTSGLSRGDSDVKSISIPPGFDTLELNLRIDASQPYPTYRAVLQTLDGAEKLRNDSLIARSEGSGGVVAFQVPVSLITEGAYYIKLGGVNQSGQLDNLGRYPFRVTR